MNYILKEKLKNKDVNLYTKNIDNTIMTIDDSQKVHFPPSVNEWHNSIYTYNKRALVSLLTKDSAVYALLDNYFNLKPNRWIKIKIKRK